YSTCTIPTIRFTNPTHNATPTFKVADHDTTWTFQVDQPSSERTFELVTPEPTIHAGDPVALRLTPSSGTMFRPHVHAIADKILFSLEEGPGLWRDESDLHFTVPAIA